MSTPAHCVECGKPVPEGGRFCPACGAASISVSGGEVIDGKYEILEKIGEGGMGEVYRARHLHLDEIRIIKVMKPGAVADATQQRRFQEEARMATVVRHPNVAALYDFSRLPSGAYYMVSEFIDGITLHQKIERSAALPAGEAIDISLQVLSGLAQIHQAGIVHRDLSPDNIMVSETGGGGVVAKIIDLGIAKRLVAGQPGMTGTGMFLGKLRYCSPEQAGGLAEGEALDGRSDLYSFGAVLYEMLTGENLFAAQTPEGYLLKHLHEPAPEIDSKRLPAEYGPALAAVVRRALEKDRSRRFQSADEFARALSSLRSSTVSRDLVPTRITPQTAAPPRSSSSEAPTMMIGGVSRSGTPTQSSPSKSVPAGPARGSKAFRMVAALVVVAGVVLILVRLLGGERGGLGKGITSRGVIPPTVAPALSAVPPPEPANSPPPPPSASLSVSPAPAPSPAAVLSEVSGNRTTGRESTVTSSPSVAPPPAAVAAPAADDSVILVKLSLWRKKPDRIKVMMLPDIVDAVNEFVRNHPNSPAAARIRTEFPLEIEQERQSARLAGRRPMARAYHESYLALEFAPKSGSSAEAQDEAKKPEEKGVEGSGVLRLIHEPVLFASSRAPIRIKVQCGGASGELQLGTLFFKALLLGQWQSQEMKKVGSGLFEAEIPEQAVRPPGVLYYIEALGPKGEALRSGGARDPHRVTVRRP